LVAFAAYFTRGDGQVIPLSDDVFRITYNENVNDVVRRFIPWLEKALINGLAEWRRTLA